MSTSWSNKENATAQLRPSVPQGVAGQKRPFSPGSQCVLDATSLKRPRTDPLVHHGRHFGRTVRTFCRVQPLISFGLAHSLQMYLGRASERDLSPSQRKDYEIYQKLLALSPGLEESLCTGSEQDIFHIAAMITKGASSSRSNDTKSLKSVVIDWITPFGSCLTPPLHRNIKSDRGFIHDVTGALLCPVNLNWNDPAIRHDLKAGTLVPSGDMWPRFLYRDHSFNPAKPWEGLLRSAILVSAFKHVFTSPSSVGDQRQNRATRPCNAVIHGMKSVTAASIAYIATQVRFALSSSATFSRSDRISDSEFFYTLIIELLEDPEEAAESSDLLAWWDRQIFPSHMTDARTIRVDSVFALIKEVRRNQGERAAPRLEKNTPANEQAEEGEIPEDNGGTHPGAASQR